MKSMNPETFNEYIHSTARTVITDYNLIEPNDLIAVGLSGGKDSILTLNILVELMDEFEFDIVAVSIDEGISGYRGNGIDSARNNAAELGVKLVESSFKEEYGFTLDQIAQLYKSACIPCGVFRRQLLNKMSNQLGANKLATGHNLDDEYPVLSHEFCKGRPQKILQIRP